MADNVETFIIQVIKKENEETSKYGTEILIKSLLERGRLLSVENITKKKNTAAQA